jgi:hypothetical protein
MADAPRQTKPVVSLENRYSDVKIFLGIFLFNQVTYYE